MSLTPLVRTLISVRSRYKPSRLHWIPIPGLMTHPKSD